MTKRTKWHPYPKTEPHAKCGTLFRVKLSTGLVDTVEWRGEPNFEWQYYDDEHVVAWAKVEEEE